MPDPTAGADDSADVADDCAAGSDDSAGAADECAASSADSADAADECAASSDDPTRTADGSSPTAESEPAHTADIDIEYATERRARTVAESIRVEVDEVPDERSRATVTRDGRVVSVTVAAADLVALRAGGNTWLRLVGVAEDVSHSGDDRHGARRESTETVGSAVEAADSTDDDSQQH